MLFHPLLRPSNVQVLTAELFPSFYLLKPADSYTSRL